jgi:hypothetical protein
VLFLFLGLLLEELGQQRERPLVEMSGDGNVLHAGAEFVPDLFVEGFGEL